MKRFSMILAFCCVMGLILGTACTSRSSGSGEGNLDFGSCVSAWMDYFDKEYGDGMSDDQKKMNAETACQTCKDKPGGRGCKAIMDALEQHMRQMEWLSIYQEEQALHQPGGRQGTGIYTV